MFDINSVHPDDGFRSTLTMSLSSASVVAMLRLRTVAAMSCRCGAGDVAVHEAPAGVAPSLGRSARVR
jgi:hypothetical protein